MNSRASEVKEPIANDVTDDEVAQLISEREAVGATNCKVIEENGTKYLVCLYPPV